jgi:hypothetical protein
MATLRTATSLVKKALKAPLSMTQSLTTPSKVAHVLDWKKATSNLLTLRITKQSIECAVAAHPSLIDEPVQALPSIPLKRVASHNVCDNNLSEVKNHRDQPSFDVPSATQALQTLIHQHDVCGIVVLWPTEQLEGWNGAACGRTLHVLDHISLNVAIGSNNPKPICLYDPHHLEHAMRDNALEDEWGRTAMYSTTTKAKVVHCAKQPQSLVSNNMAAQVWSNFCREYWPDCAIPLSKSERNVISHHVHHLTVDRNDSLSIGRSAYQFAF